MRPLGLSIAVVRARLRAASSPALTPPKPPPDRIAASRHPHLANRLPERKLSHAVVSVGQLQDRLPPLTLSLRSNGSEIGAGAGVGVTGVVGSIREGGSFQTFRRRRPRPLVADGLFGELTIGGLRGSRDDRRHDGTG
jgi:hypothetical protein